jgi:hypothetical protein
MFERDHQTAEQGEADKNGNLLLPAHEQPSMVAKPCDGAFNDPASLVRDESISFSSTMTRKDFSFPFR